MFLSDALSRLRTHDVNKGTTLPNIDVTIHEIDTHVSLSQMQNLQKITNEDPVSQLLKRYIADGWPSTADECQESVRKYFHSEMSFVLLMDSSWKVDISWYLSPTDQYH